MRIISLTPAGTEILFALGAGPRVRAVTDHCDYPPEVADLDRVGPFGRPDADRITALQPDLVVTGGKMHQGIETLLADAGINTYSFFPTTVEQLLTAMEELGELSGTGKTGRGIINSLRERVLRIREQATSPKNPTVLFLMGEPPLTTPGPASCQYDALRLAGAGLVSFPKPDAFVRLAWEELTAYDPEVILACGRLADQPVKRKCPGCSSANPPCRRKVEVLYEHERLAGLRAVQAKRIHPLSCFSLCRPGPRLVDGMEQVRDILRPQG